MAKAKKEEAEMSANTTENPVRAILIQGGGWGSARACRRDHRMALVRKKRWESDHSFIFPSLPSMEIGDAGHAAAAMVVDRNPSTGTVSAEQPEHLERMWSQEAAPTPAMVTDYTPETPTEPLSPEILALAHGWSLHRNEETGELMHVIYDAHKRATIPIAAFHPEHKRYVIFEHVAGVLRERAPHLSNTTFIVELHEPVAAFVLEVLHSAMSEFGDDVLLPTAKRLTTPVEQANRVVLTLYGHDVWRHELRHRLLGCLQTSSDEGELIGASVVLAWLISMTAVADLFQLPMPAVRGVSTGCHVAADGKTYYTFEEVPTTVTLGMLWQRHRVKAHCTPIRDPETQRITGRGDPLEGVQPMDFLFFVRWLLNTDAEQRAQQPPPPFPGEVENPGWSTALRLPPKARAELHAKYEDPSLPRVYVYAVDSSLAMRCETLLQRSMYAAGMAANDDHGRALSHLVCRLPDDMARHLIRRYVERQRKKKEDEDGDDVEDDPMTLPMPMLLDCDTWLGLRTVDWTGILGAWRLDAA